MTSSEEGIGSSRGEGAHLEADRTFTFNSLDASGTAIIDAKLSLLLKENFP